MSRRSLEENLKIGILTPGNISELLTISQQTVRKFINAGKFPNKMRVPGSKEIRIPATDLVEYLKQDGNDVPANIAEAAKAFLRKYNPDFSLKPQENLQCKAKGETA